MGRTSSDPEGHLRFGSRRGRLQVTAVVCVRGVWLTSADTLTKAHARERTSRASAMGLGCVETPRERRHKVVEVGEAR